MLLPKVSVVPSLLVVFATPRGVSAHASTSPHRIPYVSLEDVKASSDDLLLAGGLVRDGIVSVTDVPSFKKAKRAVLTNLQACIADVGDAVATQRFPDGTVRRSFATSTTPGGGAQPLKTLDDYEAAAGDVASDACVLFRSRLGAFRSTVDLVTRKFAERLSAEMGSALPSPILRGGGDYRDIAAAVAGGEHLEHFHSYQKVGTAAADEETIEFHTDQGLFIAFTPGMIVSAGPSSEDEMSDGFYVQGANGEKVHMEFTGDDDLVFMMGDGVNQFINDKLTDGRKALKAAPHALTVPALEDASRARVWYGRMVLPPSDAFLPSIDSTFGEVRQILVDSSSTGDMPLGVGCSTPSMNAFIDASRKLDGGEGDKPQCAEDSLYCWFRCMSLADHGIASLSYCADELNLGLQCASPRLQVIPDGNKHGDYYPQCTNNTHITHPYTDYPEIDQRSEDVCAGEWAEYVKEGDYDHTIEVSVPKETARDGADIVDTKLSWSVVKDDDGAMKIKARLAYNEVFGWLAIGFADPEGKHNGMNGGNIILAKPGGNYSPVTGLDLEAGPSTGTYKIHSHGSSFRHWMDPIETEETQTTVSGVEIDDTGCFTVLTFESDHINGKKFNFEGSDDMIWAGNHLDHFMGHHGYGGRARFTVNWATGEMTFKTPQGITPVGGAATPDADVHTEGEGSYADGHEGHDHEGHDHDDGDAEVEAESGSLVHNGFVGLFVSLFFGLAMNYF